MRSARDVFITGATGYMGRALAGRLAARGHRIRALVRPGSEGRAPPGCVAVPGNALDASTFAAQAGGADTFVQLVGVAQPAPVMQAYVAARMEAEALLRASGLAATILRPWYVLGPGHRWPLALLPAYWLFERIPATRASATRLGLVTLAQMVGALAWAVENPAEGVCVLDVPDIRARAAG